MVKFYFYKIPINVTEWFVFEHRVMLHILHCIMGRERSNVNYKVYYFFQCSHSLELQDHISTHSVTVISLHSVTVFSH